MDSCVYTYANQKGKNMRIIIDTEEGEGIFFGNQDINSKIMTLNVFITMSCTAIEVGLPSGNFFLILKLMWMDYYELFGKKVRVW